MATVLLCLSALLALGWLPILFQFYKNWRNRNNPISLAICFAIAFTVYLCLVPFLGDGSDPIVTALSIQGANAATCAFFHISFGWAKRRWTPGDRIGKGRITDYPISVQSGASEPEGS